MYWRKRFQIPINLLPWLFNHPILVSSFLAIEAVLFISP